MKKRKTGLIILALFVLLSVGCGLFAFNKYNYYKDYNEAYKPGDDNQQEFVVNRGESYNTIGAHLQEEGLIADAQTFIYKTKILKIGPRYQAGTFLLTPSMTMEEIMEQLQNAKREAVKFTIPEGYSISMIAQKLASEGLVDEQKFYDALDALDPSKYWFMEGIVPQYTDPQGRLTAKANTFEGFLFPDTYEIFVGSTEKTIIEKMLARFDQIFTEDMKAQLSKSGYSLQEIMTIASLVEREVATDEERPLCSSVVYNRLDAGMPLQYDSPIQYILGELKVYLSIADTKIESPYNTYLHTGIPPAPICCPGQASIKAALEPADTKYLYFVLKSAGSNKHNWAETYSQFLVYKNQYTKSK